MTRRSCDRDSELLNALRAGAVPAELRRHVGECTCCETTERAASLLLAYSETMTVEAELPSAAGLWREAQRRRQEAALRGAAKGLLAMRTLGVLYVLGAMAWALRMMWQAQPAQGRQTMLTLTSGTVPLGVGAAVVLLVAGAATLMFLGQQQGPLVR